jgi:enterochelin esterase-like enzyme
MRKSFCRSSSLFVISTLLVTASLPLAVGQEPEQKITVGEVERTFVVHLPKGYDKNQKYPVVMVLHSTNQEELAYELLRCSQVLRGSHRQKS